MHIVDIFDRAVATADYDDLTRVPSARTLHAASENLPRRPTKDSFDNCLWAHVG